MNSSAAITGIGTISSAGTGIEALSSSLANSQPQFSTIQTLPERKKPKKLINVHSVSKENHSKWISPNESRRMSSLSFFAVVAGKMALANAGLNFNSGSDPESAIIIANTFGPSSVTQAILDQHFDEGPTAVSPFFFSESVTNSPSAHLGIQCQVSGPNHTISGTEAGCLMAVAMGAQDIQSNKIRRAMVGTVEEINPIITTILHNFNALATDSSTNNERARPFDLNRNGFTLAEGSTVLILENEIEANNRGRKCFGKITGWGNAFDPTAPPTGWGSGVQNFSARILSTIEKFGISPSDFDLIVSGASGSKMGDKLEAKVLNKVWNGTKMPPVITPKAITGEFGGAFLASAVLAINGFSFGPPTWFKEIDPELGIQPNPSYDPAGIKKIFIISLGFGGSGAWLIVDRP